MQKRKRVPSRDQSADTDPLIFPVRINKYLAYKKITTRRGADELILHGMVKINGIKASLGDKVTLGDRVEVARDAEKKYRYFAYHKPRGVITHSPEKNEKSIADSISVRGVFPRQRFVRTDTPH
jgi:23S rRNA pseudouridine2604 synthase